MADKNNSALCGLLGVNTRGNTECGTCICTDKIFDSVKDKECIEDLRVYLTEGGQDAIDRANNIRAKDVEILRACISVGEVAFNKGYYSISIRYYFRILFEACIPGGRSVEFYGIAVYDKNLILYGGEGGVNVFCSDTTDNRFCCDCDHLAEGGTNLPKACVEVADPIVLSVKLADRAYAYGNCCCSCGQIPEYICGCVEGALTDSLGNKNLYVTLGIFSIIRMQRPQALMIKACDYCIPEKDADGTLGTDTSSPCEIFKSMSFPTAEFCPPAPPCCQEFCNNNTVNLPSSGVGGTTSGTCGCKH